MKKSVRILSVVMAALMLCLCLASCGKKLSGEYYWGDKEITKSYATYEFKGNKVIVTTYALGKKVDATSFEGTYKIKGDEITITAEVNGEEKSDTSTFEKLDNGNIKIGALELKQAD